MLKRRSRHLALILVLAMLATLFVGVGTASAATTYSAATAPTRAADTDNQSLGTILIDIDYLDAAAAGVNAFLVTLPDDFDFNNPGGETVRVSKNADAAAASGWEPGDVVGTVAAGDTAHEIIVRLNASAVAYSDVRLALSLSDINIGGAPAGDIDASITGVSGQFGNGSVTVGFISEGSATISVVSTVTIAEGAAANVTFTVKEDSKNGIARKNETIKFKLPKGFEWSAATPVTIVGGAASADFAAITTSTDNRTLYLNRVATADPKSVYRFTATINSDEEDANFGDVLVTLSGQNDVTPASVNVGTYSDFGYTVKVKDSDTAILAGRTGEDAKISSFRIKETTAGSLLNNRTIIMELPEGVEWTAGTVEFATKDGNFRFAAPYYYANSLNKVRLTINNNAATKGEVEIKGQLNVAVDYKGPVTINFSGSAGVNEEITVANVTAPISATSDAVNVIIGAQDQPGSDIVITESEGEALIAGAGRALTLTAPAGVSFSKLPNVTATDLSIGTVTRALGPDGTRNNVLRIPIRGQSDNGGTITVSNLYYSVDRTVAEGAMKITIGGNAVDDAGIVNRTVAASVVAAQNVTSAGLSEAYSASFTVGSTSYMLNDVQQTMDVAPYIKGDRTFMPVRYVAYSLGIGDSGILWDETSRTVTLMKGDKVVQLKIGSPNMLINGASVTMDVAPEITSDRTMLPLRFIAQAFGADVGWDAATQTATIN